MAFDPDKFIADMEAQPLTRGFDPNAMTEAIERDNRLQQEYGEGLGTVRAGVEAAARGLSFGVSDWIQRGLGVDAEGLRERKERNPIVSTTSEIGAAVLPILASGGSSLLAKGAASLGAKAASTAGAAVQGVAKLGSATERAVLSALGSSAAKETAKSVLKNAVARGAGSAVEGAFYGAGQLVSETALGNKELNAEGLLSTIGLGTLLGGTLGGAFGAIEAAAPTAIEKMRSGAKKLYEFAGIDEEGASYLGMGPKSRELRAKATMTRGQHEEVMREFKDTLAKHYDEAEDIAALLGATRNNLIEANLSTLDPVSTAAAKKAAAPVVKQFDDILKSMRSEPEVYSATGRIRQAEQAVESLKQKLTNASTSADIFRSIDDAKAVLWIASKRGKFVQDAEEATINSLVDMAKVAQKHLEDTSIYGAAAEAQAQANKVLNQYMTATQMLRKRLMDKKLQKNGSFAYEVSPTKLDSYLRNVDTIRNEGKDEALFEFLKSTDDLLNQVDESFIPLQDLGFAKAAQKLKDTKQEFLKPEKVFSKAAKNGLLFEKRPQFDAFRSALQALDDNAILPKPLRDSLREADNQARTFASHRTRKADEAINYVMRELDSTFGPLASNKTAALDTRLKRTIEAIDDPKAYEAALQTQQGEAKRVFRIIDTVVDDLRGRVNAAIRKNHGLGDIDFESWLRNLRLKGKTLNELITPLEYITTARKYLISEINKVVEEVGEKGVSSSLTAATAEDLYEQTTKALVLAQQGKLGPKSSEMGLILNEVRSRLEAGLPEEAQRALERSRLASDAAKKLFGNRISTNAIKNGLKNIDSLTPVEREALESILGDSLDNIAATPAFVRQVLDDQPIDAFRQTTAATQKNVKETFDIARARAGLAQLRRDQSDTFLSPFDLASYATGYFIGGPVGLAAAAIIKLLNNPYQTVQGLAAIERAAGLVNKRIDKGVGAFVKMASTMPKPKLDVETQRLIAPASVISMSKSDFTGRKKKEDRQEAYRKRLSQLAEFTANPQTMNTRLLDTTTKLEQFAPETANALRLKAQIATKYLFEMAPKNPVASGIFSQSSWVPSDAQLASWERRLAAVQDPFVILNELESGILTSETVDAVEKVYPQIFNAIRGRLMAELSNKDTKISYPYRLQLSKLFKIASEPSYNPGFILTMQRNFAAADAAESARQRAMDVSVPQGELTEVERVTAK